MNDDLSQIAQFAARIIASELRRRQTLGIEYGTLLADFAGEVARETRAAADETYTDDQNDCDEIALNAIKQANDA